MGFEPIVEERHQHVDPHVETTDWSSPRSPARSSCSFWLVDGVRRVELRLLAEDGGNRAPGLFGSYAVGAVGCRRTATFAEHQVSRAVVLGGGLMPTALTLPVGTSTLSFEPATDPGADPNRPLWRLQQLMRQAEAALAARLAQAEGEWVLVDGPLTFSDATRAPVVGAVKRFARHYLGPQQESLLGRLGVGQRTPLFALGEPGDALHRFAWYLRLSPLRAHWHDLAGIIRCEVRIGVGREAAIELADRVSGLLPEYAGRPTDPRAPQNLGAVGGLESWLRHRMGAHEMVHRALLDWLVAGGGMS